MHLHASRTFHRDVKTGNILLDGSLQPLQTAHGTLLVSSAFHSDVGLAKVREASAGTCATTHATTRSLAFSLGFADSLITNSDQHSEKTDAFGIGVCVGGVLIEAARTAAEWPGGVVCELARVVFGLACAYKRKRMPLPEALAAIEAVLHSAVGAAASEAQVPPPPALLEEEEAAVEGAAAASTPRKPTALT